MPVKRHKNSSRNRARKRNIEGKSSKEGRVLSKIEEDRIEEHPDGLYVVRSLTGSSSTKPYRCPGCDQIIPTATPHIVAWPDGDESDRRHWHKICWNKRNNRKPKIQRTRNAPRY